MAERLPRRNRNEKGQSLVELAFGMVVLLILVAGIVDLGRLLFFYIALRDAAQEATVVGQLNPRDCDAVTKRVIDYLGLSSAAGYDIEIQVDGAECSDSAQIQTKSCSGKDIRVTIGAPFTFVMPLMGGRQLDLSATIEGTVLRPVCPTP